jgi:predicted dehydrogenase
VRADIWANYREVEDGSWYDDPAKCPVAPIFRLGIYLINDLLRLVGRPVAVSVMSSRIFTGRPTADTAQAAISFADGTLANIFSSFCINDAHWWMSSLTLNYENGTVYRNVGPTCGTDPRREPELAVVTNRSGRQETFRAIAKGASEDYQWDVFYDAILGHPREDELLPEDVVAAIRVVQAMARAQESGKTEPVLFD